MTTDVTTLRRKPWGKVMQDVTQATTLAEAMRLGGLDFTVEKAELSSVHLDANGGTIVEYPEHRGIVRTDTRKGLAVVSATYGVVQNHDAFAPLDYLQREGIVSGFEQAGMVNGGGKVFLLANLSSESRIESDEHYRKILIATSHDGTGAVTARGWLHRVACANQLPAMFTGNTGSAGASVAKIRHTSKAESYLGTFRSAVLGAIRALDQTENHIVRLGQQHIGSDAIDRFVKAMFPMKDESLYSKPHYLQSAAERRAISRNHALRGQLRRLITQAPTQENVRGTRAALFHAAVEYSDYYSMGKRTERMLLGRDVAFKAKAMTLAGTV